MTLYPDADLADADWPKQTWDLPSDPAYWRTAGIDELQRLTKLPVYDHAPKAVRTVVEERLANQAD